MNFCCNIFFQLNDKDAGMLEERIKRSTRTRPPPPAPSNKSPQEEKPNKNARVTQVQEQPREYVTFINLSVSNHVCVNVTNVYYKPKANPNRKLWTNKMPQHLCHTPSTSIST